MPQAELHRAPTCCSSMEFLNWMPVSLPTTRNGLKTKGLGHLQLVLATSLGVRAVQVHIHVADVGKSTTSNHPHTHTKKRKKNSLGQPLFFGHGSVRCESLWLSVQSQQLSGFCTSGAES